MSVKEAALKPVGWKVPTRVKVGGPVARSRGSGSNSVSLSGSTKAPSGGRREGAGRNMCEPRCRLVNQGPRRATLYCIGEASSVRYEPKMAHASSGVSGATRSKGFIEELERPVGSKWSAYKHRRRNGGLVLRESDGPIVAMTPGTTEPRPAKGPDLDGAHAGREGRGDWR